MSHANSTRGALLTVALALGVAGASAAAPPVQALRDGAPSGTAVPFDRVDPHGWAPCSSWLGDGVMEDLAWMRGVIRPNEAQRSSFDALVSAAGRARETVRSACAEGSPTELDAIHRQIEAMLQAAEIICPAYDALYRVLSDDQKRRLDSALRHAGG
ncbi:hypothetical protein E9232_000674 [Inquilinus ginsengisoli]|uniref:Spy/CpxP family protein refolding chaperone n=1 Tax=Inquilinus ginsengisoli TaxID=363840 RepID=A0ABU1JHT6_9PROT|nr:Spy/CpxP family protein refolding chaperone [Inquilinus ginsengisoli]MDR6288175.1 hypothetical protein [Inquilinus ginsengisoli]